MEKLKMHSPNLTQENIARIRELFPGCVTEAHDNNGKLRLAVDYDQLRQELSEVIVEGPQERYHLNWPGKREALLAANAPIAKTLRPCREESVDFDTTENLFIEGDNLDALKLLQENYLGKIKMIYIDPPYNTGKDFIYSDNFAESADEFLLESGQKDEEGNRLVANTDSKGRFHSDWLSMMYSRLKLARNLLRDDGMILISIDDNEVANLQKICDEIFGKENFITNIIWQGGRKNDARRFSVVHDYIAVYVKNDNYLSERQIKWRERKEGLDEVYNKVAELKSKYKDDFSSASKELKDWFDSLAESNPAKEHSHYTKMDNGGAYYGDNISSPNYRENLIFEYKGYNPPKNGWRYNFEAMTRLDNEGLLIFPQSKDSRIQYKRYLHHTETWAPTTSLYKDRRAASKSLAVLLEGDFFDFPKDTNVLARLIETFTDPNDIVVDFFAGSSSTAHACLELNAKDNVNVKFIMVQLPEECDEKSEAFKAGYKTIAEISKERIRRAGKKVVSDKWAVMSKEEKVRYGCKELSRADCMAKGDGTGQGDLFAGQKAAAGRTLQFVGSDASSSSVDSVEHSRGAVSELNPGVYSISGDRSGIESRTGDPASSLRESGIPCRYGYFGSDTAATGDREDGVCSYKNTIHCPLTTKHCPDIGFRVLKVDSSNLADIYYTPDSAKQDILHFAIDNLKPDRTSEDLLFQVLLDWGVELSLPIKKEKVADLEVYFVDNNALAACFVKNGEINDDFCKELAKRQPLRAVFRDSGFKDDSTKINAEQIFKLLSPHTDLKTI